jgi:hypothetical protein
MKSDLLEKAIDAAFDKHKESIGSYTCSEDAVTKRNAEAFVLDVLTNLGLPLTRQ